MVRGGKPVAKAAGFFIWVRAEGICSVRRPANALASCQQHDARLDEVRLDGDGDFGRRVLRGVPMVRQLERRTGSRTLAGGGGWRFADARRSCSALPV